MSAAMPVLEQNQEEGRTAIGVSRVRREPTFRTTPTFQERPGMRGTLEPCNGHESLGSFGDFHLEPREFIREGRGPFVCVTATLGQGRRSGLQLSLTAYAVVTVEDDKIRHRNNRRSGGGP